MVWRLGTESVCEIVGSNTPFVLKLASITNDSSLLLFATAPYDEEAGGSNVGFWMGTSNTLDSRPVWMMGCNESIMMTVNSQGNLGIGTSTPEYKLHCQGDFFAQGNIRLFQSSDSRIKENIQTMDVEDCLRVVTSLPLRTWKWAHTEETGTGWIAQEAERAIPRAVAKTSAYGMSDFMTLNHDELFKCLYGAVQRLVQKVDALDAQLLEVAKHFPSIRKKGEGCT